MMAEAEVWYSRFETDDGLARQCRQCGVTTWPASPDPERSAPADHDPTCAVGAAERLTAELAALRGAGADERAEAAIMSHAEAYRLVEEARQMMRAERDVLREAADRMVESFGHWETCGWAKHKLGACGVPWPYETIAAYHALAAARGPAGSGEGA